MSSENPRPRRRLSIGIRLTLWSAGTTLASCALLCFVLYTGFRSSLFDEVDGFIEGEVRELASIVTEEMNRPEGLAVIEQEARRELGSRPRHDLVFRVFDDAGRRLMSSDLNDGLPDRWDAASMWQKPSGDPVLTSAIVTSSSIPYRLATSWVTAPPDRRFIVQAAYRTDEIERSLAAFRRNSALALLVVGLAAIVGGNFVSSRSLRPVDRITETAMRIGVAQLQERIVRSGNGDELDRLAMTLNDMLDRIQDQVRRMQQFTADASHELRTPLAALRGSVEVALSQPRSADELRATLEENMEQFARLTRIATDLLFLARADVGKLALQFQPVRMGALLAEVVELYSPLAEDRRIQLNLSCDDGITLMVDAERIRQVLINLLDNAMKYMGTGDTIDLRLSRAGASALIEVRDNGPGIAAEHLPHIFDRFYRVSRARTNVSGVGAGLGLAISKSIIDAHGGRIEISCQSGTTVAISLPLDR